MQLILALWLFALFAALVTLWSRKQARLTAELKRKLDESERKLNELQDHIQRAMDSASVLNHSEMAAPQQEEPAEPPRILH